MPDQHINPVQQTLLEVTQLAFDSGLSDFLLIGGNAVIAYGVPRFTRDIDLVIPEREERAWRSLMDENGFELIHGTPAFCQFLDRERVKPRIDLMIVDESTWTKLIKESRIPEFFSEAKLKAAAPEHLIAMKLKSVTAPHRRSDNNDWSDIVELVRRSKSISLEDDDFKKLVIQFGNADLWQRLKLEAGNP